MKRISTSTLCVIAGLELSVLWILIGLEIGFAFKPHSTLSYIVTLGAHRHTVMTIAGLILIPICAWEIKWGFLAAMVLGIVTSVLTAVSVIELLIAPPPWYEGMQFGPFVWIVIQIPIILFSYQARKELGEAKPRAK
ncbi:MAG: hypothetical protein IMY86_05450 [Chloroflexi bacterium]|nr:hypothetical protein [Chloroflexota bacterium]